jgi:hypothetical protein
MRSMTPEQRVVVVAVFLVVFIVLGAILLAEALSPSLS